MADRSDRDDEIAGLRADLTTLRTDLDAVRGLVTLLDQELRRANQRVDVTMRGQLRCRGCGGRRIGHAPQVEDQAQHGHSDLSLFTTGFWGTAHGKLEAYVCLTCGLVEWWVGDPGALKADEEDFHILDGEAQVGKEPFR